eukprot:comp21017_c0_seq1/m.28217 comp21017_c0_seq1/g.28217  ORF comp21017_c0_seq1/g.28217 comp21017_c0_seq1/m.28217 type:complete len:426 (-) comp21017_c0_seq1:266-1543(-)
MTVARWAILLVAVTSQGTPVESSNSDDTPTPAGVLHYLNQTGAVCLDGTPGAYYLRNGTGGGVNKWYIHFQGGGWCTDDKDCVDRSEMFLGSTAPQYNPPELDLQKVTWCNYKALSQDPTVNPLMHDWNAVVVRYCDGGSYAGNRKGPYIVGDRMLWFRGHHIMRALIYDLLKKGMKNATDVVVGGGSAGGLGTVLQMDLWRNKLPASTRLTGFVMDSFFLDYNITVNPRSHQDKMQWVFNTQRSIVPQACAQNHSVTGDQWRCMFPEHALPYVPHPIFLAQSAYDIWQLDNIIGSKEKALANDFGREMYRRLSLVPPQHGGYVTGCSQHTTEFDWLSISSLTYLDAHEQWYYIDALKRSMVKGCWMVQEAAYPCQWCCGWNAKWVNPAQWNVQWKAATTRSYAPFTCQPCKEGYKRSGGMCVSA